MSSTNLRLLAALAALVAGIGAVTLALALLHTTLS